MTPKSLKIDVFGRRLLLISSARGWAAFDVGSDGKRCPIDDIVIPSTYSERELLRYLDDLFHERATEQHPKVKVLERT